MKPVNNWYEEMTKGQKIFVYTISVLALPFFVGIPALLVLIYLELGVRGRRDNNP